MHNDSNYRNSPRNDKSHHGWSYHSGDNTDRREAYRGFDEDRLSASQYDHDAARRSRGLRNDPAYGNSKREQHYLGDSDFTRRHSGQQHYNTDNRDFSNRYNATNRQQYGNQRGFSPAEAEDRDRLYDSYNSTNRSRGYYNDGRRFGTSYNAGRENDRYDRNNNYNSNRREQQQNHNHSYRQDRGYGRSQDYDRNQPYSVKDKYSSSSLHYSGITSLGEGDERNLDRYEGSQYIGRQNSDHHYAGRGTGSSQRYRY